MPILKNSVDEEISAVNLSDMPCGVDEAQCLFGEDKAMGFGWWHCDPTRNGLCVALLTTIKRRSSCALRKMKKDGRANG